MVRIGVFGCGRYGVVRSGVAGEVCCGLASKGWSVCGVLRHGVETQGMAGLASRVWFGPVKES